MRLEFGIFFSIVFLASVLLISQNIPKETSLDAMLDNSVPYVGIDFPNELGYDGEGIVIGIIDTGVDHMHPDLYGFGPGGKIIAGYNYVDEDKMPLDTNGHGTQVAGVIAAEGELNGLAPKSKIIAYKVSEDGEGVSSRLIIKAIEQAIVDDVDIINISLGINRTNSQIDSAVNKAIEKGIVVVTAAGNDGPDLGSIGSPGINPNSITVGATYNNITASLVGTLEVNEKQYQVIPMVGTQSLTEPIEAEIVFGEYGRERDFVDDRFENSIVLVERGSDVEDEIVYFSDKESNAADAGAIAIIVFNNEPGLFLGELTHEFNVPDYNSRIPTLSMSREEGLFLKESLVNKTFGSVHVFYNPDYVAHFSSRGPVSPFYIKPDLVAPGAFINTTLSGGNYNFTSGTSFATPHVSGAAALLLQKNPNLLPHEIKSILLSTTDQVTDAYDNLFPLDIAGVGRLNVTKAFEADLIISPPQLIFNLSSEKPTETQVIDLKRINDGTNGIDVSFTDSDVIDFDYKVEDEKLFITASTNLGEFGKYEVTAFIKNNDIVYNVPLLLYVTEGSVSTTENNGELNFVVSHPQEWSYAKISIKNAQSGKTDATSARPYKDSKLSVYEDGEYWIEANIEVNGETFDAFDKVHVSSAKSDEFRILDSLNIPERQIVIVFGIAVIIALVGFKIKNNN